MPDADRNQIHRHAAQNGAGLALVIEFRSGRSGPQKSVGIAERDRDRFIVRAEDMGGAVTDGFALFHAAGLVKMNIYGRTMKKQKHFYVNESFIPTQFYVGLEKVIEILSL